MTLNIKNRLLEHRKASTRGSALKVNKNSHGQRPGFPCTFLTDGVGKALIPAIRPAPRVPLIKLVYRSRQLNSVIANRGSILKCSFHG